MRANRFTNGRGTRVRLRLAAALSIAGLVAIGLVPVTTASAAEEYTPDTVTKTADPPSGSSVTPGQVITYTITANRDGNYPRDGWYLYDDLSQVLNNATLVGSWPEDTSFDEGSKVLRWSIDMPGETMTDSLTFQVKVNDNANGAVINNSINSYGTTCPRQEVLERAAEGPAPAAACNTTHRVIAVAPPVVIVPAPAAPIHKVPRRLPHTGA